MKKFSLHYCSLPVLLGLLFISNIGCTSTGKKPELPKVDLKKEAAPATSQLITTENQEGKQTSTDPLSHDQWTILLKKHVSNDGLVDYKGFKDDVKDLDAYLALLSKNAPTSKWSKNDQIAYWLNAYNAFTIKLILDNYPVKSIKDIGPKVQVIFINTPWDKNFFAIDGKKMSLNDIEHKTLRKDFTEPRIHFALNCASQSCPKLRNEAYTGTLLDKQLEEQAKDFINDPSRNKTDAKKPMLSSIFNWYGGDMKKWTGKSLIAYINQYAKVKINEGASLDYLAYDWNLNEKK